MKRIVLKTLEGIGYKLVHSGEWSLLQNRLTLGEAAQRELSAQLNDRRERAERLQHDLSEQLNAQRERAERLQHDLSEQLNAQRERANALESQLTNCLNDRHRLGLRNDRAEARVQALARSRDRLRADLTVCRELAAAGDPSGRLGELENENRRMRQQLSDLKAYLRETRQSRGVSYL